MTLELPATTAADGDPSAADIGSDAAPRHRAAPPAMVSRRLAVARAARATRLATERDELAQSLELLRTKASEKR